MKIYEKPECFVCKSPAMCIYGGTWICGRCLEKAINKEREKQKSILNELIIQG
jgi:hypothetical protein